jgi:hypothetical protein
MKANELRVGNWCQSPYEELPFKIKAEHILQLEQGMDELSILGIPLTPEILVKAGFENFEDGWYSLFDFTWNIYDKVLRWMGVQIKCHDLHQLQNLYFALTGEELNIQL